MGTRMSPECFSLYGKSPMHLLNIEAHLPPTPGTAY
jgi:hypothetical protein